MSITYPYKQEKNKKPSCC